MRNNYRRKKLLVYNIIDNEDTNENLMCNVIEIFNEHSLNICKNMTDDVWRIGNKQETGDGAFSS